MNNDNAPQDKYIVILTRFFPPEEGGTQSHTYGYTQGFINNGRKVIVLTVQYPGYQTFDAAQPFTIIRFNDLKSKIIRLFSFFTHTVSILRRYDVDFLFTSGWSPGGIVCYLIKILFRKEYVVSAHGTEILRFKYRSWLRKKVFNTARQGIAVSDYTKHLLIEKGVKQEVITVLPNGVAMTYFHPGEKSEILLKKYALDGKRVIFLTVTRLEAKKGVDTVIKTIHSHRDTLQDIYYLVIGKGGYHETLAELIEHSGLGDIVKLIGYVSPEELLLFYQTCDVFIMVSREDTLNLDVEGFGISYIEAGACGKPVIASNNAGVVDAVQHDVTGITVNPESIDEVFNAMLRLKDDADLRKRLGENGYDYVRENFVWDKIAAQLLQDISRHSIHPHIA